MAGFRGYVGSFVDALATKRYYRAYFMAANRQTGLSAELQLA